MLEKIKKNLPYIVSAVSLFVFILYTILVKNVDVDSIGPNNSSVGFSKLNVWFSDSVKSEFSLYTITDIASVATVPIGFVFLIIGIVEWVKRKNIFKVDANILALGVFYLFTLGSYLFFQFVKINYRPALIEGALEVSYPSSTTVLALTVCLSAIDQVFIYFKNKYIIRTVVIIDILFCAFLIVGRLFSGVHWLSDIIGALLLSITLISLYFALKKLMLFIQSKLK